MKSTNYINNRFEYLYILLLFSFSLIFYLQTLTPGLLTNDSGEFQTLAILLGNTHPTGYPIYLLIGKLFSLIPIGSLAWRINLLSSVMASFTLVMVFLASRYLIQNKIVVWIITLTFAISPTFWSQAIIAEVYTTGTFFLATVITSLLYWYRTRNKTAIFVAGLMGGLSLGIHMSIVMFAPAIIFFLFTFKFDWSRIWRLAILGALFGSILVVVSFSLIHFNNSTPDYYNSVVIPSRFSLNLDLEEINGPLDQLIFGWSGKQFKSYMFDNTKEIMLDQAKIFFHNLPKELGWLVILFAFAGLVHLILNEPRIVLLLGLGPATQLVYLWSFSFGEIYVFYIPVYLLIILFALVGADSCINLILRITGNLKFKSDPVFPIIQILAASFLIINFIFVLNPNIQSLVNRSNPFDFQGYPKYDANLEERARETIINLPPNSIVYSSWNMMWPYYHMAYIYEGRQDLTFITPNPDSTRDQRLAIFLDCIENNPNNYPIIFPHNIEILEELGYSFSPISVGPEEMVLLQIP